jgi:hypothetical protein
LPQNIRHQEQRGRQYSSSFTQYALRVLSVFGTQAHTLQGGAGSSATTIPAATAKMTNMSAFMMRPV